MLLPPVISPANLRTLRTLAERFMQDTCTLPGGAVTRCRFAASTPTSGRTDRSGDRVEERGSYRLALPLSVTVSLLDATITYRSRVFDVVWDPPSDALAVERVVGLEEAR